jgi:hypothetical protein
MVIPWIKGLAVATGAVLAKKAYDTSLYGVKNVVTVGTDFAAYVELDPGVMNDGVLDLTFGDELTIASVELSPPITNASVAAVEKKITISTTAEVTVPTGACVKVNFTPGKAGSTYVRITSFVRDSVKYFTKFRSSNASSILVKAEAAA